LASFCVPTAALTAGRLTWTPASLLNQGAGVFHLLLPQVRRLGLPARQWHSPPPIPTYLEAVPTFMLASRNCWPRCQPLLAGALLCLHVNVSPKVAAEA
jgi:hypothetical protein